MDRWTTCLMVCLAIAICSGVMAEDVVYGVGSWPANMGNHRARLSVEASSDAVWARIPWRRHNFAPGKTSIAIVHSASGSVVSDFVPVELNCEYADLVFKADLPGEYEIYYMIHAPQQIKAERAWLERNGLDATRVKEGKWKSFPRAKLIDLQARTEFDRFDPMEVIATREEVDALLMANPTKSVLFFPEDRRYPVRMTDHLPQRWIKSGPSMEFRGEAARGEFYTFQIGVYAARTAIDSGTQSGNDVKVGFGDLRSASGGMIPATCFSCPSISGFDWLGRPMTKSFKVGLGKVRPLWFGVQVPEDIPPGEYTGTFVIKCFNVPEAIFKLTLNVTDQIVKDAGDSELWRHSRLWWLDSRIGIDDGVVSPYTPIEVNGNEISVLGRCIKIGKLGLPESIKSSGKEILARPMEMVVKTDTGVAAWGGGSKSKSVKESPGRIIREYAASGDIFSLKTQATIDFDGYGNFSVVLKAKKDAKLKDIRLEIPVKKEVATYMMGLGCKGGYRPREWQWTWDINRANNTLWIGDVDAGVHIKLKGSEDTWDMFDLKASGLPKSWCNENRGGCTVTEEADCVLICAYSGERTVRQGEETVFRFGLLVTPVKPLNMDHFNQRYCHAYLPLDEVKALGANIVNIHHANELNPYINYPFLAVNKLAAYVREAHAKNLKVKIYYTVRELSNHCVELWALRSLGDEIFMDGSGGGDPWLREHLVSNYTPAWVQKLSDTDTDAAIATTGLSRWHNYYLEGLAWLLETVEIDGLYLDGIGYDREVMKRVRKVMEATRPGCLIDFHSGNEFTYEDRRISPACKYAEHFPYIDSLWFGEMYDYENESPDYWLVEVSGIPFGLFGDMLEGGGNPWRGMIYGMACRFGVGRPMSIWKLWNDFGIAGSKMMGYWSTDCPIKTNNSDVLATVYSQKGAALIVLASWAKKPVKVKLSIDWKALGLDVRKADLTAPAVEGLQEATDFQWTGEIPVEPGKGWFLLLKEK
ncbi:MAG: DUF6067 family protein [Armatimonadetes bacterium]|nr:DUF6067 family protein [Armatimonadota bacterium]